MALALALWAQVDRPQVLIADTGALVGVMTERGRALSKPRGAGFIALNWLENDGDGGDQEQASARWDGPPDRIRTTQVGGVALTHLIGKKAAAQAGCVKGGVLVFSVPVEPVAGCTVFDPVRLRDTGSVALYADQGQVRFVTAKDITGVRLWNSNDRARPWNNKKPPRNQGAERSFKTSETDQ